MRQWLVEPAFMCRQHLLGEHVEIHMFIGAMLKGVSMLGYLREGMLEPRSLESRHAELVTEMTTRGYRHESPIYEIPFLPPEQENVTIDRDESFNELMRRCPLCRDRAKAIFYSCLNIV